MNQPSSRYLTHDFLVYQGLSLKELLVTGVLGMLLVSLGFTLLGYCLGWPGVCASIGLVLGFYLSARVFPKLVARKKQGKPHGYLKKWLIISLSHKGLMRSPYISYRGIWRKQRLLGEKHV